MHLLLTPYLVGAFWAIAFCSESGITPDAAVNLSKGLKSHSRYHCFLLLNTRLYYYWWYVVGVFEYLNWVCVKLLFINHFNEVSLLNEVLLHPSLQCICWYRSHNWQFFLVIVCRYSELHTIIYRLEAFQPLLHVSQLSSTSYPFSDCLVLCCYIQLICCH